MLKRNLVIICAILLLASCSRGLTPAQAASGNFNKCRAVR